MPVQKVWKLIKCTKYYLTYSWEYKGVHTISKSINLKVNITVRLEFEITHFKAVVQHFSHSTTKTLSKEESIVAKILLL